MTHEQFPPPTGEPVVSWPPPSQVPSAPPAGPYGTPVPPSAPSAEPPSSRPPNWMWPAIAVMTLVIGLIGGAIGGALVANRDSGADVPIGSGGVVRIDSGNSKPLAADNQSIPAVAAKVLPSTVQVIAEYEGVKQGATGSGWVLDGADHIVTNAHVVASAVKDRGPIEIVDASQRHWKATVVGISPVYDIAVLKVSGNPNLPPMPLGASKQLVVGQTVVAAGSPLGLTASITSGIVSALNRPVTTGDDSNSSSYISAVQTDAAINPGNSGGPLVNLRGQVIGVNSALATVGAKSSDEEAGNIGVGFAIPIEQALTTAAEIIKTGHAQYPVIGATVSGTAAGDGAHVKNLPSGSPAAKVGIKVGDVITAIDGELIGDTVSLVVAIRTHLPGDTVTLTVQRGSKKLTFKVKLDGKVG